MVASSDEQQAVSASAGFERRAVDRARVRDGQITRPVDVAEGSRPTACVLVVDNHQLFADVLVQALRHDGFIAHAVRPESFVDVLVAARRLAGTVALVDLDLGSAAFTGLDLIEPLTRLGCEVVTITATADRLLRAASLERGALGTIDKADPVDTLMGAVKLAARGELRVAEADRVAMIGDLHNRQSEQHLRLAPFAALTPRERMVLGQLIEGMSAEAIAAASFVSMATVRSHIRGILTKLSVSSQLEAVAAAQRAGWRDDGSAPISRYSPTLAL